MSFLSTFAQGAARRMNMASRVQPFATTARDASTLVVVEAPEGNPSPATLNALTAASKIGGDVSTLVVGNAASAKSAAESVAKYAGVSKVIVAADDQLANPVAEHVASVINAVHDQFKFTHIVAAASSLSKGALPRVAAQLDVQPISEITEVKDENTFVRPIYAGNALATVESTDPVKVITVRPTTFEAAAAEGGSGAVEESAAAINAPDVKWVKDEIAKSDRPDLATADVVVAGGRGLKNGENFEMLYTLADKLGGAVGASRAAVDAGFVPNDMQIGQTGKVVAPKLYVAVGISGAIQHLAGMKDSKTIVCINKDPDAPIFQVSDYGLVGDLFNAVPEMTEKV
eukprot:GFYU01003034.1.p2 GENE.GFYU01003034.1~~GFYU01003034.1.p2  ORF type:complete len:344 (-),score=128.89 GFYU01003034.1:186-1217(-)